MRISGIEPPSVILSQTKKFQNLKSYAQKVPKSSKSQKGFQILAARLTRRDQVTRINTVELSQ